jgi:hypothetical protein
MCRVFILYCECRVSPFECKSAHTHNHRRKYVLCVFGSRTCAFYTPFSHPLARITRLLTLQQRIYHTAVNEDDVWRVDVSKCKQAYSAKMSNAGQHTRGMTCKCTCAQNKATYEEQQAAPAVYRLAGRVNTGRAGRVNTCRAKTVMLNHFLNTCTHAITLEAYP